MPRESIAELLYLALWAVGIAFVSLLLYWVIRYAVKHGMQDATRRRD